MPVKIAVLIGGSRDKMDILATLSPNVAKFVLVALKTQWQFLATLTLWPLEVKHGKIRILGEG